MTRTPPRLVRRYEPAQRVIHWFGVASFLALLVSGLALLLPPLAFLAAGGLSRVIHRLAAVPFLVLPVAYVVLLPREAGSLLRESITFTREDGRWLRCLPAYLMGRTCGLPPQGRLNAGQKLHHAVTFLAFATIALSGVALWFGSGRLGTEALAVSAIVHDVSMLALTVLLIGHVYFTFLYDAFGAMRTGFVTEDYARLEHARWLGSLPPDAFTVAPAADANGAAATSHRAATGE
jgi:formate dehydrogenase subunit gamma